jgi:hypothetical protein
LFGNEQLNFWLSNHFLIASPKKNSILSSWPNTQQIKLKMSLFCRVRKDWPWELLKTVIDCLRWASIVLFDPVINEFFVPEVFGTGIFDTGVGGKLFLRPATTQRMKHNFQQKFKTNKQTTWKNWMYSMFQRGMDCFWYAVDEI